MFICCIIKSHHFKKILNNGYIPDADADLFYHLSCCHPEIIKKIFFHVACCRQSVLNIGVVAVYTSLSKICAYKKSLNTSLVLYWVPTQIRSIPATGLAPCMKHFQQAQPLFSFFIFYFYTTISQHGI